MSGYKREEPPKLTNDNLPARTYYRLPEAAEIIGCTVDTLIHYGATAGVELLAPIPKRALVYSIKYGTGEVDDSFFWSPVLFGLPPDSCRDIELLGSANISRFHICYEIHGNFVLPYLPYEPKDPDSDEERKEARLWSFSFSPQPHAEETTKEEVTSSQLLMFAKEIRRFKESPESTTERQLGLSESGKREGRSTNNKSKKLALLNQAFMKYWANADPSDSQTHPKNADVVLWLMNNGYEDSRTLAEKAATIIRPEWAATGRPQEK